MHKWLSIIGIGEDGVEGLPPMARSLLNHAQIVVGGKRHLAFLPPIERQERWVWQSPIHLSIDDILQRRGQSLCVLASGDPMCYGIGVTLSQTVSMAEMTILPAPSAFSHACARLGWPLMEVETLSLCGRDPALVRAVLTPNARLLILCADQTTPGRVAALLTQAGYGQSEITILEYLGGSRERLQTAIAATFSLTQIADLNLLAVVCRAAP
jgi:precorrin-6B C5,15-methyltransferase / cobalt-precorrin-6B C5,C15-methyltransferase